MTRHLGPWILGAGICIGAGLYFGLRAREPAAPAPAVPVATPAAPQAPPSRDAAATERDIRAAFEALRTTWKAACWDPIVARSPAPPASQHELGVTVDAGGTEILRAINDVRGHTRLDVAACLRDQPFEPVHVAAPGRTTSVTLTIQFP